MENPLVVLGESDASRQLLQEAADIARAMDTPLVLLSLLTEEEYERDIEVLEIIDHAERTESAAQTFDELGRRQLAREIGEDVAENQIGDHGVEYRVVGAVVDEDQATSIIETAEQVGSDHVFLTGTKRSPVGKAVFGDLAQRVILDYSGAVTVRVQ